MRGIFVLLLGTLLRVKVAAKAEGMEHEVSRFVSVECNPKGMTISLSYDYTKHRYSMTRNIAQTLSEAKVYVGSYGECQAENNKKKEEHMVKVGFNACGVRVEKKDFGTKYTSEVVVNVDTSKKPTHVNIYMYTVGCTILNYELGQTRIEVSRRGKPVDSTSGAIEVPVNGQLRMEIKPAMSIIYKGLQDMYTYPATCAISSVTNKETIVILEKGCPMYKGKLLLSSIYQKEALQYTATGTEIFINTFDDVFPSKKPDVDNRYLLLNVSCDVFFCTSNAKQRILGVPLCPSAAPCESPVRVQNLLLVGGEVPLYSAHLPVPVRVDLERDGGVARERTPIRQPQTDFPPEPCVSANGFGSGFLFALVSGALIAGLAAGICVMRVVYRSYIPACGSVRLSSAVVSQADHAPQPYFKLERTPRLLSDQPTVS